MAKVHDRRILRMAAAAGNQTETKARLGVCWERDIDWRLYPDKAKEVSSLKCTHITPAKPENIIPGSSYPCTFNPPTLWCGSQCLCCITIYKSSFLLN